MTRVARATRFVCGGIGDIPQGHFIRLLTASRASGRPIAMPRHTDPMQHALEAVEKNIATIKRGVEARAGEIKRELVQWLDQTRHPSESVPISIALLEIAFDRYLATHDEQDARDLIDKAFRRAVQRHRGTLQ